MSISGILIDFKGILCFLNQSLQNSKCVFGGIYISNCFIGEGLPLFGYTADRHSNTFIV